MFHRIFSVISPSPAPRFPPCKVLVYTASFQGVFFIIHCDKGLNVVHFLLQKIQKPCRLFAVHLNVMKLKTYRQSGLEKAFAVLAPHHHRVAELVVELVDDDINFGADDRRRADYHIVVKAVVFTFVDGLLRDAVVIIDELIEIVGAGDIAKTKSAFFVFNYQVDSELVVMIQFAFVGQNMKFLHP